MTQYARPASTIQYGVWLYSSLSYHEDTDEVSQNGDTDYAYINVYSSSSVLELKLSGVTDPQSSVDHVVNIYAKAIGSAQPEKATFTLYEGSTLIATILSNGTITRDSYNLYTYTLTSEEADSITDYTDLRIRFIASIADGENVRITQCEFLCPDAAGIQVNKDLQAEWDIDNLVNKDLAAQYDLLNLVSKDLQVDWDIFNPVNKDLQGIWDIDVLVNKDLQAIWDMSGAVSKDLQGVWDINVLANKDLEAQWDIFSTVDKDLQLLWDIRVLVNKDLEAIWDMSGVVNKDLAGFYDVFNLVNKDLQGLYDILDLVNKDLEAQWDIFGLAYKDLEAVWDIESGFVFKDLEAIWDILGELKRRGKRSGFPWWYF
jgi:hypothetical protein